MNPYTIIGGLVLLVIVAFGGAHIGKKLEREKWQAEKIALQEAHVAELTLEINNRQRAELFNQAKARKASEDHAKAVEELRKSYNDDVASIRAVGGLRIPSKCPKATTGATEGAGASGPDEASAATEKLPDRVEERLFGLTKRADELAEQLRGLQAWVRDNGHYGTPK